MIAPALGAPFTANPARANEPGMPAAFPPRVTMFRYWPQNGSRSTTLTQL